MNLINQGPLRILTPDKGYKLVNKNTGKSAMKFYLGKNDSVNNYTEIVDEAYSNINCKIELDEFKEENDVSIDLILLTIDEMFKMFEPILASMPQTLSLEESELSVMARFYNIILQRGLKTKEEIPEKYLNEIEEFNKK